MIFRSQTYLIATASIIALSLLPVSAEVGPLGQRVDYSRAISIAVSAADHRSSHWATRGSS
jgi:hypothetical protein